MSRLRAMWEGLTNRKQFTINVDTEKYYQTHRKLRGCKISVYVSHFDLKIYISIVSDRTRKVWVLLALVRDLYHRDLHYWSLRRRNRYDKRNILAHPSWGRYKQTVPAAARSQVCEVHLKNTSGKARRSFICCTGKTCVKRIILRESTFV